jgi:hypothetical protein
MLRSGFWTLADEMMMMMTGDLSHFCFVYIQWGLGLVFVLESPRSLENQFLDGNMTYTYDRRET